MVNLPKMMVNASVVDKTNNNYNFNYDKVTKFEEEMVTCLGNIMKIIDNTNTGINVCIKNGGLDITLKNHLQKAKQVACTRRADSKSCQSDLRKSVEADLRRYIEILKRKEEFANAVSKAEMTSATSAEAQTTSKTVEEEPTTSGYRSDAVIY